MCGCISSSPAAVAAAAPADKLRRRIRQSLFSSLLVRFVRYVSVVVVVVAVVVARRVVVVFVAAFAYAAAAAVKGSGLRMHGNAECTKNETKRNEM